MDKFIINKSLANEFVLTIKQTGTTLPMEIIRDAFSSSNTVTHTPKYTVSAATTETVLQNYVAEVPAVAATQAVTAVAQVVKLVVGATTFTDGAQYSVSITHSGGTESVLTTYNKVYTDSLPSNGVDGTYDSATSKKLFIDSVATNLNGKSYVSARVVNNEVYITSTTPGSPITVTAASELVPSITTVVANVVGVTYIAGSDAVPEIPEIATTATEVTYTIDPTPVVYNVKEVLGVDESYTIDDTTLKVTVPKGVIVNANGGVTVNTAGSLYDVYTITTETDDVFTVTPAVTGDTLDSANLSTFDVTVEASGTNASDDTFVARLIKLEDGVVTLDSAIDAGFTCEPTNLLGGQITLSISSIASATLISKRGGEEDRYYLRPTYKIVIECDTKNNGKFTAKIPEVYVE